MNTHRLFVGDNDNSSPLENHCCFEQMGFAFFSICASTAHDETLHSRGINILVNQSRHDLFSRMRPDNGLVGVTRPHAKALSLLPYLLGGRMHCHPGKRMPLEGFGHDILRSLLQG
jgi:hypothetical protein